MAARVAKVGDLAAEAGRGSAASLNRAAEALNLAALVASDCGMADLARTLCRQQFEIFRAAVPFDADTAKLALQPAINLARLLLREGQGLAAHQALRALFDAVRTKSNASFDGRQIDFADLVSTDADHRKVVEWLWTVVLADGTRALTTTGRWAEALRHVEKNRGIGNRLFDGRQVVIVARCLSGEPTAARMLIAESVVSEPWEQALTACLTALCLQADGQSTHEPADMLQTYLRLESAPSLVAFRTRLAIAIHDLTPRNVHDSIVSHMVRDILAAEDGLAARTVLNQDQISARLTSPERTALTRLVRSAGLDQTTLPPALLTDIRDAAQQAAEVASRRLQET